MRPAPGVRAGIGLERKDRWIWSSAIRSPVVRAFPSLGPCATARPSTRPAAEIYRISSGASTPSSASPAASTVTIALHQREPRHGCFSIILDNEA